MSLSASLNKYKSELASTAARNTQSSSANQPVRAIVSVSSPASFSVKDKRTHEEAFTPGSVAAASAASQTTPTNREVLTHVMNATAYLREKNFALVSFENLISYLSLPVASQRNIPLIKSVLTRTGRVEFVPKAQSGNGKDSFRYRPMHPVTNADELRRYLDTFDTGAGLSVKEIKDGWPDCAPEIDRLESEGYLLVTRHKKDNAPRFVWPDSPSFHVAGNGNDSNVGKVDNDFQEFWRKTKLPANETDVRMELERAGLTPTSAVKEKNNNVAKKKERKRTIRPGAKFTNVHMRGILREYPGKRG